MNHGCVAVEDDETAVRLGGSQGWVWLWNHVVDPAPYGESTFCVEIGAAGMTARLHRVPLYNEAPDRFMAELAESFEGWSGEKTWESVSGYVTVKAVFKTWGYVDLTWALDPRRMEETWKAQVVVRGIQAGEEMRKLAADLGVLLG